MFVFSQKVLGFFSEFKRNAKYGQFELLILHACNVHFLYFHEYFTQSKPKCISEIDPLINFFRKKHAQILPTYLQFF